MKIKDVEARVGITKANIRFYEKEGLLNPGRSEGNNYREYSEEDIRRLKKIKSLRMLNIPTADIRLLFENAIDMQEVMAKRMESIEREEKELQEMRKLCQTIIDRDLQLDTLDETIFEDNQPLQRKLLEELLTRDMVEEKITRRQLNKTLTLMLLWGYFISTVVTVCMITFERKCGISFMTWENDRDLYWFLGLVIISIVCIFSAYFTANVRTHILTFHISALILAPSLTGVIRLASYFVNDFVGDLTRSAEESKAIMQAIHTGVYEEPAWVDPLGTYSVMQFVLFWLLIMLYVVILYIVSEKWEKMFMKMRYTLAVTAGILVLYAGVVRVSCEQWIVPWIILMYLTLLIGMKWTSTVMDRQTYNRYYAVKLAGNIINFIGLHMNQMGRGSAGAWLK